MRRGRLSAWTVATLALALVLPLGAADPAGAQATGVTADTIKIGFFGALTGPYYLYGKLVMNGADVVYNEVNRAGGIHGRKIQTVREDDACDAATAIAAAKKLIHQHQVFMVHGGGCSNPTIAAREEFEASKRPFVVFAAVADKITVPLAPYIFSSALTARTESFVQVDFALSKPDVKRIAIVSQHDAWGNSRYEPLKEALKKKNITPVADEEMTVDANDGTAQVLRIMQAKPDAVIMLLYPKPGAIFLRDAHKLGLKTLFVAQTAISDLVAFEQLVGVPGALENFFSIAQVAATPEDPKVQKWAEILKRDFPDDRISIYTLFGIASAQVVVEALKRAGKDLTPQSMKAAMEKMCGRFTDLYAGEICWSPEDHQGNKTGAWIRMEKGKVVNIGAKWVPPAK
jgi:branched-chain amino acid transport system substrate-binding protein